MTEKEALERHIEREVPRLIRRQLRSAFAFGLSIGVVLGALGGFVSSGLAQEPQKFVGPVKPEPPAVSDLTRAQIDNVLLREQLALLAGQVDVLKGKLAPQAYQEALGLLQQQRQGLVATFEKEHPGWTLNVDKGAAEKKPEPKKDEKQ